MRSVYFVALAGALVLNATANLMMKFGIERFKAGGTTGHQGTVAVITALAGNWVLLVGLGLFAANVMLYVFALKGLPISIAYPIMVTTGFAIIVVVAGIYLHERLSGLQWAGVALILAGVWLVGSQADKQLQQPAARAASVSDAGRGGA